MKKVNIKLYIQSFEQFKDFLQRIVTVFSYKDISHLEINLVMVTIDDNEMEMILNLISKYHTFKDTSNDTIYTFIATVNPSHRLPKLFAKIKGLISRIDLIEIDDFSVVADVAVSLRQKRFPSSLIIKGDDLDGILNKYRNYSFLGIPVFAESDICYDDKFTSLFWKWFYDKSGYRINIFSDLLSKILLDYWGTICQYKSCLTKYFVVDEIGDIYGCKTKNNRICNLREISTMNELISHKNFIQLLKKSIEKRSQCKNLCDFYGICQGGCPMGAAMTTENCENRQLFLVIEEITERIKDIVHDSDYRDLNPAVRELILSSVASNKLFEKGLFE